MGWRLQGRPAYVPPTHPPNQELISGHFGEDCASYEPEIRELTDLRQVGRPCLPVTPTCPPRPNLESSHTHFTDEAQSGPGKWSSV